MEGKNIPPFFVPNFLKECFHYVTGCVLSHALLFVTPWTGASFSVHGISQAKLLE